MLRHLRSQNAQLGGMLLVNIGREGAKRPTFAIALSSLERLHPQWFESVTSLGARVEELEETLEERDTSLSEAHRCIGKLESRVVNLEQRLERLERRMAA